MPDADATAFNKLSETGDVDAYAKKAMVWAAANGVITGVDGKYLQPLGNAQRCQMAKIITVTVRDVL